jgi:short-subunit dehydrogenase
MTQAFDPRRVLITGASSGLGHALAIEYAREGRTLVIHGRDEARLARVRNECEAKGASVTTLVADLRDVEGWIARLTALDDTAPIDLAIVNAGVTHFDMGAGEDWRAASDVLVPNLEAAIATAATLAKSMRTRGHGRIALVSSLAAYYGFPTSPAYSASKAALKAYGEALRGSLAPHGVVVSVVLPGFIRTPMSDRDPRRKNGVIEAGDAAHRIVRGVSAGRARIAFPLAPALGAKLLALLPASWAGWIVRRLGY